MQTDTRSYSYTRTKTTVFNKREMSVTTSLCGRVPKKSLKKQSHSVKHIFTGNRMLNQQVITGGDRQKNTEIQLSRTGMFLLSHHTQTQSIALTKPQCP